MPLRQVCRICTLLCKKRDLCGAALSAIEGSKFRAVNAQERHLTQDRLTTLLAQIDERIEAYLKDLDRSAGQDEPGIVGGAQTEALAAKIEALKQRKRLYEGFQAQLLASSQDPLSLTDPERLAMKRGKGRGTEVCYNVQTAVDAKHKLMVAGEVTNDPGDRDAAAAGRPGLRRVAALGSWVGSLGIRSPRWKGSCQRQQAFACPGTALQQQVLTQSGAGGRATADAFW